MKRSVKGTYAVVLALALVAVTLFGGYTYTSVDSAQSTGSVETEGSTLSSSTSVPSDFFVQY